MYIDRFVIVRERNINICGAKKSAMRNGRRLANDLAYRAPSDPHLYK
jgi:hypothetical protein